MATPADTAVAKETAPTLTLKDVLSLEEWKSQGKKKLSELCSSLSLDSSGTTKKLAQRLVDHYKNNPAVATTVVSKTRRSLSSSGSDSEPNSDSPPSRRRQKTGTSPNDSSESRADADDNNKNKDGAFMDDQQNTDPAARSANDQAHEPTPPPDDTTQEYDQVTAATAFQTAQANSLLLKDIIDRIALLGSAVDLSNAEVRAIRSKVEKNPSSKLSKTNPQTTVQIGSKRPAPDKNAQPKTALKKSKTSSSATADKQKRVSPAKSKSRPSKRSQNRSPTPKTTAATKSPPRNKRRTPRSTSSASSRGGSGSRSSRSRSKSRSRSRSPGNSSSSSRPPSPLDHQHDKQHHLSSVLLFSCIGTGERRSLSSWRGTRTFQFELVELISR